MTRRELVARLRDVFREWRWRLRRVGWDETLVEDEGPMPDFPALRNDLARAAALAPVRRSLARIRDGRLRFLGRDWPPVVFADRHAAATFWLHDPISRRSWPGQKRSAFAIDVRSTSDDPAASGARGDVKYVWEPNRLQILHPLSAALARGDAQAGEVALGILRSWAEANPPFAGVNWVSGIEIALRLVSVSLLVIGAGPEGLTPSDRGFVRRFVAAHAEYLAAFPSLHSSANNHRVAEGLGLLAAGLLMPEAGAAWAEQGREIVEREAERQILADGVGVEQSPTYQAFTMEMLAFAALLCRATGRPLVPAVEERLALGAAFLLALMDAAGQVPLIGDDDEGRVLGQPPDREPRYVASVVAAVAGLTRRPDLMPPARDDHLRDELFSVGDEVGSLALGRKTFHEGGYTTSRDRIAGRTATFVFDHGPLGYLSLAAHGHADALAVWLSIDDQPVLIDSGTYLYFSGGPRRTRLRESAAHNTLCLRDATQSIAAAGFNWVSRASAGIVSEELGAAWSVTGWHDGYERRFGVRHLRRISRVAEGYTLADRITPSREPSPCDMRFLLHPDLDIRPEAASVVVANATGPLCRLTPPPGFELTLGSEDEPSCLYSPDFGALLPAKRITLTGSIGRAEAVTAIEILGASSI